MRTNSERPWFRKVKNSWYAWVDGKQISLTVRGRENKKAALDAFYRLMASDRTKPQSKNKPTVQEIVGDYLADAAVRLKPSSVTRYRTDLNSFCRTFGNSIASELTPQVLTKWITGLKINCTSKAIAVRSLSACFGWAVDNNLLPTNPVSKVARPKSRSRSQEAIIGEAVHEKLMASASPDFRLLLRVLHGTGCRPGEVCQFTTETFVPEAGCVVLEEHKTDHTGKSRVIFLPPDLVELLKAQVTRYGSGALFRSRMGNAWTGRRVTETMRRVRRKAGVKAIAYGYRHSFATDALAKGVPDATVASLLGHGSTAMLHKHYAHLTSRAEVLRNAVGKVR